MENSNVRQPKFSDGQRVILKKIDPCPGFPEGLSEERGVVLGPDSPDWESQVEKVGRIGCEFMYVVEVDPRYRMGNFDDLLREVSEDQMESEV